MSIDPKWEANELLIRLLLVSLNIDNAEDRIPLVPVSIEDWLKMDHETLKKCFTEFVTLFLVSEAIGFTVDDIDQIIENNRFNAIINDNFSTEGN